MKQEIKELLKDDVSLDENTQQNYNFSVDEVDTLIILIDSEFESTDEGDYESKEEYDKYRVMLQDIRNKLTC